MYELPLKKLSEIFTEGDGTATPETTHALHQRLRAMYDRGSIIPIENVQRGQVAKYNGEQIAIARLLTIVSDFGIGGSALGALRHYLTMAAGRKNGMTKKVPGAIHSLSPIQEAIKRVESEETFTLVLLRKGNIQNWEFTWPGEARDKKTNTEKTTALLQVNASLVLSALFESLKKLKKEEDAAAKKKTEKAASKK